LLTRADVVVHDRLSSPALLDLAPPAAERIDVGKAPGRVAMNQEDINQLLVERGRSGATVIRLKGGDPFVFGRGGEEALALRHAGIACEIVPGVSSAIAAPSAVGIPVTHRGVSGAMLVLSGHDEHTFAQVAQGLAGRELTIVVLMGLARARSISWTLINDGWPRGTPVAIVADATMSTQHHWRGTLDDLAADRHVGAIHRNAAATIVVGDVVTFARAAQEGSVFTTEREASTAAEASVDKLAERRVFQCL